MIIPSVDLSGGKAVQLRQGAEKALERENPLEIALSFARFGEVAVIDLDAAMEKGENERVIKDICGRVNCRVGGGIRTVDKAKKMVSYGAGKIIIGTQAFTAKGINAAFLSELVDSVGKERIIVAVDAREGEIVTRGWTHRTGIKTTDMLGQLEEYCAEFLFTCVEKEGLLGGTNMALVEQVTAASALPVVVAGGITTLEDVEKIAALNAHMQLGMAVYTGQLRLEDAFIASLDWSKGLLPTITVDRENQVLMVAYSSRESLHKMFETRVAWYYSRSRKRLWQKGETSGNVQVFEKIRMDCDRDALLLTVRPPAASCHTGAYSCFGDKVFSLYELYGVLQKRLENPPENSYTASLSPSLLREKILEEAQELVEAANRVEIIWEAADVLYFVTVLLAKEKVALEEVLNELRRRRRG